MSRASAKKSPTIISPEPISAEAAWAKIDAWFAQQGWQATEFQRAAWQALCPYGFGKNLCGGIRGHR
jgi:hypothetical protein